MKVTLENLIAASWPESTAGVNWIALSFQGKSDLERKMAPKIKSWSYGDPHFIVLRDQDGRDCIALKNSLGEMAQQGGRPFTVRVVCNELESWFLGDLDAVELAFPNSKATKHKNVAKFRNPDLLTNASEELQKLVNMTGKVGRAEAIAKHFRPSRCVSASFQVFWATATTLIANNKS